MWNKEKLKQKGFDWFTIVYNDFAERSLLKKASDSKIIDIYEKETGTKVKKILTNKNKKNEL